MSVKVHGMVQPPLPQPNRAMRVTRESLAFTPHWGSYWFLFVPAEPRALRRAGWGPSTLGGHRLLLQSSLAEAVGRVSAAGARTNFRLRAEVGVANPCVTLALCEPGGRSEAPPVRVPRSKGAWL